MPIYDSENLDVTDEQRLLHETWWEWLAATYRELRTSVGLTTRQTLQRYLAQAEANGRITEFQAIMAQFVIAVYDTPDFAIDYLQMAEAAATSERERCIARAARGVHDHLAGAPRRPAGCIASMRPCGLTPRAPWREFFDELCAVGATYADVSSEICGPCAA